MKSPGLRNKGQVGIKGGPRIISLEACRNGNATVSEGHLRGGVDFRGICEHEGPIGKPGGELYAVGNVDWNSEFQVQGWM